DGHDLGRGGDLALDLDGGLARRPLEVTDRQRELAGAGGLPDELGGGLVELALREIVRDVRREADGLVPGLAEAVLDEAGDAAGDLGGADDLRLRGEAARLARAGGHRPPPRGRPAQRDARAADRALDAPAPGAVHARAEPAA